MNENEIAKVVVDAAIEVHRTLGGPGRLEAANEEALAFELESRGLRRHRESLCRCPIATIVSCEHAGKDTEAIARLCCDDVVLLTVFEHWTGGGRKNAG